MACAQMRVIHAILSRRVSDSISSIGNMEPGDVKIKFVRSFQFQVSDMPQPSVFRLSSKHNALWNLCIWYINQMPQG